MDVLKTKKKLQRILDSPISDNTDWMHNCGDKYDATRLGCARQSERALIEVAKEFVEMDYSWV